MNILVLNLVFISLYLLWLPIRLFIRDHFKLAVNPSSCSIREWCGAPHYEATWLVCLTVHLVMFERAQGSRHTKSLTKERNTDDYEGISQSLPMRETNNGDGGNISAITDTIMIDFDVSI